MCLSGLWQQGLRVWFCDKRLGLGLRLGLRLPLLGPASECVCAEQLRWWHLRETIQQKERKWQTSKAVRGKKKKKEVVAVRIFLELSIEKRTNCNLLALSFPKELFPVVLLLHLSETCFLSQGLFLSELSQHSFKEKHTFSPDDLTN